MQEITSDNLSSTLASDSWLIEKGVKVEELNRVITTKLHGAGIDIDLRNQALFANTFENFKEKLCTDLSDYYWRKSGVELVFNTLVKLFKLADFSNCIFLFDEAEKLITAQNFSERTEFCNNLRYFFVDGSNENVSQSFFKILMTIHPNSQELLISHWNAAGLERFSELSGDKAKHNTIFFNPLQDNQLGVSLAEIYIKHSKIDSASADILSPFTKESLELALEKAEGIPGKFLKLLYHSIEQAVLEKWKTIDRTAIENIWKTFVIADSIKKVESMPGSKINLNE